MAWPLILAAVGAGVQIYGQTQANKAQAKAERLNRQEYLAQKRLSEMAARREADIFLTESASFIGEQVSMLAKSGIQMDGSALMEIAKSESAADREYAAIQAGAASRASMFDNRARAAGDMARRVSSSSYNNIQTLGTVLNAAGNMYQMNARNYSGSSFERADYSNAESGGFSGPYESSLFGRIGGR